MSQPGSHVWATTPIITKSRSKLTYEAASPRGKELNQNQLLAEYVRQPGSQDLDRPLCFSLNAQGDPCRRVVRRGRDRCYACRA